MTEPLVLDCGGRVLSKWNGVLWRAVMPNCCWIVPAKLIVYNVTTWTEYTIVSKSNKLRSNPARGYRLSLLDTWVYQSLWSGINLEGRRVKFICHLHKRKESLLLWEDEEGQRNFDYSRSMYYKLILYLIIFMFFRHNLYKIYHINNNGK